MCLQAKRAPQKLLKKATGKKNKVEGIGRMKERKKERKNTSSG
jgi:hypothetical protein